WTGSGPSRSGSRQGPGLGPHPARVRAAGPPQPHPAGAPEVRTLIFPIEAATLSDVWHVMGLRAPGSDTSAVSDLLVPREHTAARDEAAERREAGPLYCFPSGSLYASGFACVSLGIARALLDAVT